MDRDRFLLPAIPRRLVTLRSTPTRLHSIGFPCWTLPIAPPLPPWPPRHLHSRLLAGVVTRPTAHCSPPGLSSPASRPRCHPVPRSPLSAWYRRQPWLLRLWPRAT